MLQNILSFVLHLSNSLWNIRNIDTAFFWRGYCRCVEKEGGGVVRHICSASISQCATTLPQSAPLTGPVHKTETLLCPLGPFVMKRAGEILLSKHLSSFHVSQTENRLYRGLTLPPPRELTGASVGYCVFKSNPGNNRETAKGGRWEEKREISPHLPLMELQSGPEPHVDSMGSETPLQRTVGELGVDVGELGVDGPSRSASTVEPAPRESKATVTFTNLGLMRTWG